MRAIMMSIRPEWVAKILNKEKTIEIRRRFPKDYVGWVYIYNTKDIKDGYLTLTYFGNKLECITAFNPHPKYRGKVVARFWCDKVEEITFYSKKPFDRYGTPYRANYDLLTEGCLEYDELDNYLNKNNGYAIHITKLEIFDKPKEISEFKSIKKNIVSTKIGSETFETELDNSLTRAPERFCYIEID